MKKPKKREKAEKSAKKKKKVLKGARAFRRPDLDKVAKYAKRVKENRGSNSDFYRLEPGKKAIVRLLPPPATAKDDRFFIQVYKHWNLPVKLDKDIRFNRVCGFQTFPERFDECAICEAFRKLEAKGIDMSKYRTNERTSANALIRNEGDRQVVLDFPASFGIWIAENLDDIGDPTDFDDGVDITAERTGSGMRDTKYKFNFRPKSKPVDPDKLDPVRPLSDIYMLSDEDIATQSDIAKAVLKWGKKKLSKAGLEEVEESLDFDEDELDEDELDEDELDEDEDDFEEEEEDDFDDDEDEDELDEDDEDF